MKIKPAKEIIMELSKLDPNTLIAFQCLDKESLESTKLTDVRYIARVNKIYGPQRMNKAQCIDEIIKRIDDRYADAFVQNEKLIQREYTEKELESFTLADLRLIASFVFGARNPQEYSKDGLIKLILAEFKKEKLSETFERKPSLKEVLSYLVARIKEQEEKSAQSSKN